MCLFPKSNYIISTIRNTIKSPIFIFLFPNPIFVLLHYFCMLATGPPPTSITVHMMWTLVNIWFADQAAGFNIEEGT